MSEAGVHVHVIVDSSQVANAALLARVSLKASNWHALTLTDCVENIAGGFGVYSCLKNPERIVQSWFGSDSDHQWHFNQLLLKLLHWQLLSMPDKNGTTDTEHAQSNALNSHEQIYL